MPDRNMKNETYTDSWYLMYSSLPDLNWARLRVFASGRAEVFDCDGRTTRFANVEDAQLWLAEDEFQALETFDSEDEEEYGIRFADVAPPREQNEQELRSKMYVRMSALRHVAEQRGAQSGPVKQ
jgi:hypothetical protein